MEKRMQIKRVMILWNSARNGGEGNIKVVEHPDEFGNFHNDRTYSKSTGACDVRWRQIDDAARVIALFKLFHQIVVRDDLNPQIVNSAFGEIDEFAEAASASMYPHDYEEALNRIISDRSRDFGGDNSNA
jgi:hypothetical protein